MAFEAADINAKIAAEGVVTLAPGVYKTTEPVRLTKTRQCLFGYGAKIWPQGDFPAVEIAGNSRIRYNTVKGIETHGGSIGVHVNDLTDCKLEDLYLHNSTGPGLLVDSTYRCNFIQVAAKGNAGDGMIFRKCNALSVTGGTASQCDHGIVIEGGGSCQTYTGATMEGNRNYGIYYRKTSPAQLQHINFFGSYQEGNAEGGVYMNDWEGWDYVFVGNRLDSGIKIKAFSGVWMGNHLLGSKTTEVYERRQRWAWFEGDHIAPSQWNMQFEAQGTVK